MKTSMEYKREILATIEESKEQKRKVFERRTFIIMKAMGYATIAIAFGIMIAGIIKGIKG